jgi:hypothetical protein
LLVAGWRSITSNCLLHRIASHTILSTSVAIRLYDPLLIGIVLMLAFIEDNLGSFFANSALRKRTQNIGLSKWNIRWEKLRCCSLP